MQIAADRCISWAHVDGWCAWSPQQAAQRRGVSKFVTSNYVTPDCMPFHFGSDLVLGSPGKRPATFPRGAVARAGILAAETSVFFLGERLDYV